MLMASVAALRGTAKPLQRLNRVLVNPGPFQQQPPAANLRLRQSFEGRGEHPVRGAFVALRKQRAGARVNWPSNGMIKMAAMTCGQKR